MMLIEKREKGKSRATRAVALSSSCCGITVLQITASALSNSKSENLALNLPTNTNCVESTRKHTRNIAYSSVGSIPGQLATDDGRTSQFYDVVALDL